MAGFSLNYWYATIFYFAILSIILAFGIGSWLKMVNDACQVLWTPDTSHVGTRYEVNARADFRYSSGGSATHYVQFYVEVTNNPPPPTPTSTPTPPPDDPCSTAGQEGGIFTSMLGFFGVEKDVQAQQCVPPPDIAVVASVDIASGTTPYVVGQTLAGSKTLDYPLGNPRISFETTLRLCLRNCVSRD